MQMLLVVALLATLPAFAGCEKDDPTGISVKAKAEPIQGENVRILFVGDTSFGESYRGTPRRLKKRGYNFPLKKMKPLLQSSTYVIANLETPITDLPESPYKKTKAYTHWTHVEHAPVTLKKHNITAFGLANNHTLDFGTPGLQQTFAIMRDHGLKCFGAGMNRDEASAPLVKRFTVGEQQFKIAAIAAFEYSRKYDMAYHFYADNESPGAYRLSAKRIGRQIKKIKDKDPDAFVIVYPHWGGNYHWKNKKQTKMGHALIDAGADMIIGHGGHCMQEIEFYNNKWIIYGLGNFVFLSPGRYAKFKTPQYSYGAQLIVEQSGGKLNKRMRLYPFLSNNKRTKFQPRPLNEEMFEDFIKELLTKSPLDKKARKRLKRGQDEGGRFVEFAI